MVGSVECLVLKDEHVNNNNYVSECLPDYSEYFSSGHNNTNPYVLEPNKQQQQQQQQQSSTGAAVTPSAVGTMMNTLSNATPVTSNFIDSK